MVWEGDLDFVIWALGDSFEHITTPNKILDPCEHLKWVKIDFSKKYQKPVFTRFGSIGNTENYMNWAHFDGPL